MMLKPFLQTRVFSGSLFDTIARVLCELEMDSCPVCYATFSLSPSETVARQLPCEHVACTQCLEDCFEGEGETRDKAEPVSVLTFCAGSVTVGRAPLSYEYLTTANCTIALCSRTVLRTTLNGLTGLVCTVATVELVSRAVTSTSGRVDEVSRGRIEVGAAVDVMGHCRRCNTSYAQRLLLYAHTN